MRHRPDGTPDRPDSACRSALDLNPGVDSSETLLERTQRLLDTAPAPDLLNTPSSDLGVRVDWARPDWTVRLLIPARVLNGPPPRRGSAGR